MNEGGAKDRDVARLAAFTDGVIVVSLTLLALDVRLPDDAPNLDDQSLLRLLLDMWPKYFGYVVSFLVVANYWIRYTEKFRGLRAADARFVWLNMLFLLVIGFVPFATSVLTESDGWVATTLYAATMILASVMLALMWIYAVRKRLVDDGHPDAAFWWRLTPTFAVAAVFGLSIVVAQFDADAARYVWLLLFVTGYLANRVGRRAAGSGESL